jgi:phosphoglycolate phosphatase
MTLTGRLPIHGKEFSAASDKRWPPGRPTPPDRVLRRLIGPPLQGGLRSLLGTDDPDLVLQGLRLYRERFSLRGPYDNAVYPGILPALSELWASGLSLFVATSRPTTFAERIADHFELTPCFRRAYGSESDGTRC